MNQVVVSRQTGYAKNASESAYPNLWSGLVGWWCPSINPRGGNRLFDLSPFGNTGTLTNMSNNSADWVISQGQGALDFDASDDFVSVAYQEIFNSLVSLSCSFWVYPRSSAFFEMGKYSSLLGSRGWLIYAASSTGFQFDGRDGGGYISSGASGAFGLNNWYHVCGRKNGNQWSIAVNGNVKSSTTSGTGTSALSNSSSFEIGRLSYGAVSEGYLNGLYDDIRIYNRALTEPEIRLLASKRGIGLQPRPKQYTYTQQPSGARRRRILTGMA